MEKPIRILHVIGFMNRGGAENMIMNLYRNMDRNRIQFDFVQNEGRETAFEGEIQALGGHIYRCPRYRGKNHMAYTRWWHAFFRAHAGEYPVVHGHIGSTASIYLSIAKKYGAFTIAHSHSAGKGSLPYRLLAYPTRFIADRFFACSADAAESRYGIKITEKETRCRLLKNAIDVPRFLYNRDLGRKNREKLGFYQTTLVIGHVGRFIEVKNHLFLMDVFEEIHRRNPDSRLLLVGDGNLRRQIEERIADRHLEKAVILAGVRQDVWNYYQAMDVFVMPSVFEGVPVSLVEAQAAGLPCCVSTGVPRDAAITDLVQFRSLADSPAQWAEWILERAKCPREDMGDVMVRAGYDISETSGWLQNFYLEVVTERG